jgi:hypothetical protein
MTWLVPHWASMLVIAFAIVCFVLAFGNFQK